MTNQNQLPLFSVKDRKPFIVLKVKCDICKQMNLCVYIEQLDRFLCCSCLQTIVLLLEMEKFEL